MKPWKLLSKKQVIDDPYLKVEKRRYYLPDVKRETNYWYLGSSRIAKCIALHDGKLAMVRQYRPGVAAFCTEFPGGYVDEGEQPAKAAARELEEEAGVRAKGKLEKIGSIHLSLAQSKTRVDIYYSAHNTLVERHLDDNESMEIVWRTPAQVLSAVLKPKEPLSGSHVAAVLLLKEKHPKLFAR